MALAIRLFLVRASTSDKAKASWGMEVRAGHQQIVRLVNEPQGKKIKTGFGKQTTPHDDLYARLRNQLLEPIPGKIVLLITALYDIPEFASNNSTRLAQSERLIRKTNTNNMDQGLGWQR
jgi:hypothetical protein